MEERWAAHPDLEKLPEELAEVLSGVIEGLEESPDVTVQIKVATRKIYDKTAVDYGKRRLSIQLNIVYPAGDDLYERAVRLVVTTRKASLGLLVRELNVSYPRAARLMERMEEEGIVGPLPSGKYRDDSFSTWEVLAAPPR